MFDKPTLLGVILSDYEDKMQFSRIAYKRLRICNRFLRYLSANFMSSISNQVAFLMTASALPSLN